MLLHLWKSTTIFLPISRGFHGSSLLRTNHDAWEKWVGKVTGTPNDIQKALTTLNREPKDKEELSNIILEQRRESLTNDLKIGSDYGTSNENSKDAQTESPGASFAKTLKDAEEHRKKYSPYSG